MFQDSATFRQVEMRRRRRFRVPGRIYLGYGLALAEGLFAAATALSISPLAPAALPWEGEGAWLAVPAIGVVYGLWAHAPAAQLLASAEAGHRSLPAAAVGWAISVALAWLGSLLLAGEFSPPQREIWGWLLIGAAVVMLSRWAIYHRILAMMNAGQLQIDRTALVGDAEAIRHFEREAKIWRQGAQVVATRVLESGGDAIDSSAFTAFARLCAERRCDDVLLLGALGNSSTAAALLKACQPFALNVALAPLPGDGSGVHKLFDVLPIGPANAVRVMRKPLSDGDRALKRALDLVGASVALAVFASVLLGVAILIRFTSPGPVLYRQERRGFNGKSFYILKFRSMTVTEDGRAMTPAVPGDSRITAIGHFIRRTSIDELPQLLNVLRGEMSLVGPRPHAISHDADLSRRFALYAQRQRIKPGITGWAQVNGYRGEIATQAQIEGRTRHDLFYAENWSLLLDLRIMLLTLCSPRTHTNAG